VSNLFSQCEICGSVTSVVLKNGVCFDCKEKDDELFALAKNSMKFGEKILLEELSNRCGIDSKHIMRWVRHGRFGG
jgi:hypothetical protein